MRRRSPSLATIRGPGNSPFTCLVDAPASSAIADQGRRDNAMIKEKRTSMRTVDEERTEAAMIGEMGYVLLHNKAFKGVYI
ncbi:hypothetical protein U1Q18_013392 [Sarracenia purpurea var. burkii]